MKAKQPAISTLHPALVMFLVDLSGSTSEPFGRQPTIRKADGVADVINRALDELLMRCTEDETIRDRFHFSVIGYGREVGPVLGGALKGRTRVKASELGPNVLALEERDKKESNGAGGTVTEKVTFPVWVRPQADGLTPMVQGLTLATKVVSEFLGEYPESYPPTVLHVTDGESTDGDPEPMAAELKRLRSGEHNVLLYNAHVSKLAARSVEFPDQEADLPDEFARRLYRMSSVFPEWSRDLAQLYGYRTSPETRGFVFNGDLVAVTNFITIGSGTAPVERIPSLVER